MCYFILKNNLFLQNIHISNIQSVFAFFWNRLNLKYYNILDRCLNKHYSQSALFALLGDPKAIQHPTGGHAVVNKWTMKSLYGMK